MLRWRLLLGAALIGGLAALCWLDATSSPTSGHFVPPGGWLFPLALVVCVLGSNEVLWLLRDQPHRPLPMVVYLGNLLIVASNVGPFVWPASQVDFALGGLGWPLAAFAVCVLITFLGEISRYEKPGGIFVQLALTIFSFAYVGLLLTFVVQLRLLGWPERGDLGLAALVSMIMVVKMGDTGAYTIGRIWGKHKMAPVLSPKKTWEGFAGHVGGACLGAWIALAVFKPWITGTGSFGAVSGWGWIAYGVIVGLTGLVGDLAESLLKRDVGAKDSSAWMPGFGGALDVLDSILFAAPVAYLCWIFGLVG